MSDTYIAYTARAQCGERVQARQMQHLCDAPPQVRVIKKDRLCITTGTHALSRFDLAHTPTKVVCAGKLLMQHTCKSPTRARAVVVYNVCDTAESDKGGSIMIVGGGDLQLLCDLSHWYVFNTSSTS